jgi:hypothetical protein
MHRLEGENNFFNVFWRIGWEEQVKQRYDKDKFLNLLKQKSNKIKY